MQFVLAINRLWAISYPITYNRIFNPKNARIIVVSLWSFSVIITVLYYNVECENYFEADRYSWSTLYGPCKHPFLAYIAALLSDAIILITVIIDAIAFYRIIIYLKRKKNQRTNIRQENLGEEIVFLKETCVSAIIHGFFAAIFHIDGPFIARVTKVTYTWLAINTLDR
ncbi:unnamed protein product [Onchocerca ochengi]|uniref:G_PROTEIN_RECEP_F1_2 domain-containing protein n=1 Tax=Onchocerca ochengi TaxID=42157 RepID=A0A182EPQ3_ONCOC|nr:unnamed protein product [Onchocerca ochengi]